MPSDLGAGGVPLDSAEMLREVAGIAAETGTRAERAEALPAQVPGWAEYLEPAGFRDGVSTGLFTPEGRYLGVDVRLFAAAVVLVSPAGDLHGLSHRELQVLGLLVTGASDERIAVALGITARTVELHVDQVRAKLAAPSRTAAAARTLRLGLFVPFSLVASA
jgi:DNA-binding CsgD family transcriptional regulator